MLVVVQVLATCLEWLMGFMLFTVSLKLYEISIMWVTSNKKSRTCLRDGNKKEVEMRYQANSFFGTDR